MTKVSESSILLFKKIPVFFCYNSFFKLLENFKNFRVNGPCLRMKEIEHLRALHYCKSWFCAATVDMITRIGDRSLSSMCKIHTGIVVRAIEFRKIEVRYRIRTQDL